MPNAVDRDLAKLERLLAEFHIRRLEEALIDRAPTMKLASAIDIVLALADRTVLENPDTEPRHRAMEVAACRRVRKALPEIKALPEPMPVIVTARKPGRRDGDSR